MSDDDELVQGSLGQLARPAGASWREPDEVRRTVSRRRRGRLAALGAAGLAAATAVSLAVALPHDGDANTAVADAARNGARIGAATQLVANVQPLKTADGTDERAVVRAEQAFTFALLKQVDANGADGNVVLSPSSLAIALAMLQNGAGGPTRQQITQVLRTSALTDQQTDQGWAALTADLSSSGVLDSANSLWLQHGAPMEQPFMDAMARYFRTGVWQVDFANDLTGASKAINAWVSKQTRGKITKLFDKGDLDPSTLLVLANAVYFKAPWKTKFDPKATEPAPFYKADGSAVVVPFMNSSETKATLLEQTRDSLAVQLPYEGGRFAALAIMPRSQSLNQFVGALTPASLSAIVAGLRAEQGPISLPKFTVSQYTDLSSTLQAMGMSIAFGADADLSPMSPEAGYVHSVAQRAYMKVDEKGTEAAAVTGIAVGTGSSRVGPTFDRPFLFLIRDVKTGAIVFSAQVQDPSTQR